VAVRYRVVSQIAEELGVPVHRVRYAIQTRGIQEAGWAGTARLFDEEGVARIAAAVSQISANPRSFRVLEARQGAGPAR
jgi:hypothetical protein